MSAPARTPQGAAYEAKLRRARIVALQVGRRALGIEEADWRALLERVTGERSTRAMTLAQLDAARAELERLGWTPEAHGGWKWRPKAKHAHQRMVYFVWGELKRRGVWRLTAKESLDKFACRITGVRSVEWLDAEQANKVIEALKAMAARAGDALE